MMSSTVIQDKAPQAKAEESNMTAQLFTQSGTLHPVPPFSFAHTLNFIGSFTPNMGEQDQAGSSLTKAVFVEGKPVAFRIEGAPGQTDAPLRYTLFSAEPLTEQEERAAQDRIRFFISLDEDLRPFYKLAEDDPPFLAVVQKLYGFHQVKFITPFEIACWSVLTQRLAIPVARGLKARLTERYGGSLEVEGRRYEAFPDANTLDRAGVEGILEATGNKQKAGYLAAVAHAFSTVDENWLREGSYSEVEAWLRDIRGIGEWSSRFILIRGLGRMDHVPVAEKSLVNAARQGYGADMSEEQVAEIGERYGPWQGYWALYLRTNTL